MIELNFVSRWPHDVPSPFRSPPLTTKSYYGSSPIGVLSSSSTQTGAIAGGAVGCLILLALIRGTFLFLLWRRRRRTPPSVELLWITRNRSVTPARALHHASRMDRMLTDKDFIARGRDSPVEDEELLPPFTPDDYRDPVFENIEAA
ncbi:hypothetical protein C8Q80DRAFT_1145026 [Daedaleopsis nitida]|nr:hypothetical protein C8Q80DRAFT_1145026 [Daedaleopsis nitida]